MRKIRAIKLYIGQRYSSDWIDIKRVDRFKIRDIHRTIDKFAEGYYAEATFTIWIPNELNTGDEIPEGKTLFGILLATGGITSMGIKYEDEEEIEEYFPVWQKSDTSEHGNGYEKIKLFADKSIEIRIDSNKRW